VGLPEAGPLAGDFPGLGQAGAAPGAQAHAGADRRAKILKPQAIYGYWKCAGQGNDLILFEQDGITEAARFTLPRQPKEDGDCIADMVRDIDDAQRDVIGLQVVTMGQQASDVAREWFEDNRYQDYLYLHGLSSRWRRRWPNTSTSASAPSSATPPRMSATSRRCSARATGAAATPSATRPARGWRTRSPLLKLLGAERIGVDLSDEHQLHPEQSTSAIVLHHPKAKYFTV
jgi:5-methyltetrahydrofolate--homocysteine methyltransferase